MNDSRGKTRAEVKANRAWECLACSQVKVEIGLFTTHVATYAMEALVTNRIPLILAFLNLVAFGS